MAVLRLFLLLLLTYEALSSLTGFTLQSSSVPPYQGGWWFVHYDTANHSIWMLNPLSYNGSSWAQNDYLQSYHIDTNTWTQHAHPDTNTFHTWSQSYTSIGSTLYFVTDESNVGTFNSETHELLHPHPNISLIDTHITQPCLANDGRYVFVIGGNSTTFQIYDTANNLWLTTGAPALNLARSAHTCQYSNGYIYVFGGFTSTGSTDSIEMLYIGFNDDVSIPLSHNWTVLPSSLAHACINPTSTICTEIDPELIYIFGGYTNDASSHTPWDPVLYDFVQIFDTTSQQIHNTTITLNPTRAGASMVCIGNYLYIMFGVGQDGAMLNDWQRSNALYDPDTTYMQTEAIEEEESDRSYGIMVALGLIVGSVACIIAMWMCSKMGQCRERAKAKRQRNMDLVRDVSHNKEEQKKKKEKKEYKPPKAKTEAPPRETNAPVRLASVGSDDRRGGRTHVFRTRVGSDGEGNAEGNAHSDKEDDAQSDMDDAQSDVDDAESGSSEDLYSGHGSHGPAAMADMQRQVTAGANVGVDIRRQITGGAMEGTGEKEKADVTAGGD
eukprot:749760_1